MRAYFRVFVAVSVGIGVVGCGGGGGGESAGAGAGADAGAGAGAGADASADAGAGADASADAGADAAVDSSVDATLDGAAGDGGGCPEGTACTVAGVAGVCSAGACAQCDTEPATGAGSSSGPDTACTGAYGGPTAPYVCTFGVCLAGNCNTNADCAETPDTTCGFSIPHVCGGCSNDSECYAGTVCNTMPGDPLQGVCVAATVGCAAGADAGADGGSDGGVTNVACSVNVSDVCCGGSCVAGDCCLPAASGDAVCGSSSSCVAEMPGQTTGGGLCTSCQPVIGAPEYYVDPVHGSDALGTGNNAAAGDSSASAAQCAFRTITRALEVIGASPPAGTVINVVNDVGGTLVVPYGVDAGTPGAESFPIVLPSNVTLTNSGGAVTIEVPAADGKKGLTTGFVFTGSACGIAGSASAALTVDGQNGTASSGVAVQASSSFLSNVAITSFAADGIDVSNHGLNGSALAIGAGVQSTGNGKAGIAITGSSSVAITGGASSPVAVSGNGTSGIAVSGAASLTIDGSPGATPPTTSTVVLASNQTAGISIATSTGAAQSVLKGVVCTASTSGDGLDIAPGSYVKVRGGWFLGNSSGNGIAIQNPKGASGSSIASIDLGTAGDPGDNTLQAPTGGAVNKGAGICLSIAADADQVLAAEGNVFGGTTSAIDCAGPGEFVLHVANGLGCVGNADVGGSIGAFPVGGAGADASASAGADASADADAGASADAGAGADASASADAGASADASAGADASVANVVDVGAAHCTY